MSQPNGFTTQWTIAKEEDLLRLRKEGKSWTAIAKWMNKTYASDNDSEVYRCKYNRLRKKFPIETEHQEIQYLRESARVKRSNSQKTRQQNLLLKQWDAEDDILTKIEAAVKKCAKGKFKVVKPKKIKGERQTAELLLSDLHLGKLTKDFNRDVLQKRLAQVATSTITFIEEQGNIEKVIVGLLGDLIESATMHGTHSASACEYGNAEQVQYIIEDLWEFVLLPLFLLGIPVLVVGAPGNHDRTGSSREYHYPGRNNLTFIVYKTLSLLSYTCGFKHVEFVIPDCAYTVVNVYGKNILFEHGDVVKACTYTAYNNHIQNRQTQLGLIISYMRVGHFHTYNNFSNGKVVSNGGLPGNEGYSDTKGYMSTPGQVLSVYSNKHLSVYKYSMFIEVA